MLDDFMTRATLAGIGVSLAAAPLGCFVVWRRMAYFGESTAHAAMLGIALSLTFELSVLAGAVLVSLIMASSVTLLEGRSLFMDTLLGVAGHSSIAAGLVIVSFISGVRIDLMAYLIGDILAVSKLDLLVIWIGVGVIFSLIIWRWSPLLLVTLSEGPVLQSSGGMSTYLTFWGRRNLTQNQNFTLTGHEMREHEEEDNWRPFVAENRPDR